jgi:hypothetical protein
MGKILFPKYFPSCPTNGAEYIVEGFTDAITSNIANTMKMFWRPRKIKLSGSYTLYDGTTNSCSGQSTFELVIQSPYGSEEAMICEPYRPWTLFSSTNTTEPPEFYWDSKPFYKGEEDNLFTLNYFEFGLTDPINPEYSGSCPSSVLIAQIYAVEGNPVPYGWQPLNIAGVNFNVATYNDPDRSDQGFIIPSVEVTEWWSFGGTYNTSTGEPL